MKKVLQSIRASPTIEGVLLLLGCKKKIDTLIIKLKEETI